MPPSQLCVALILQTKDRVSDEEAIERSEHRIARLEQLGIRQARYFGRAKVAYQLAVAATVANLVRAMVAGNVRPHALAGVLDRGLGVRIVESWGFSAAPPSAHFFCGT